MSTRILPASVVFEYAIREYYNFGSLWSSICLNALPRTVRTFAFLHDDIPQEMATCLVHGGVSGGDPDLLLESFLIHLAADEEEELALLISDDLSRNISDRSSRIPDNVLSLQHDDRVFHVIFQREFSKIHDFFRWTHGPDCLAVLFHKNDFTVAGNVIINKIQEEKLAAIATHVIINAYDGGSYVVMQLGKSRSDVHEAWRKKA